MTEYEKQIFECLDYNPTTGSLKWKVDISRKARAGGDAGSWDSKKVVVCIRGKQKAAHLIVWFMFHRKWPTGYLKARDGDLTNLRIDNFFEQTVSESVSASKTGDRSGTPGVTWSREKGSWQAHITRNYKSVFLGYFEDKDAAIAARVAGEAEGFGIEATPEKVEQIKLQARQRTVWKRTKQAASEWVAWSDFQAFSAWVDGEPKGWLVVAEDTSKPVGPDNAKWIDKPENKYDRTDPESMKAYRKERREAKPDMYRGHALKRDYGMTVAEYAKMLEAQNGVCAICKKPETNVKNGKLALLSVDHCHSSGKVRGLLCGNCNLCIGYAKDNITVLQSAIDYLKGDQT